MEIFRKKFRGTATTFFSVADLRKRFQESSWWKKKCKKIIDTISFLCVNV